MESVFQKSKYYEHNDNLLLSFPLGARGWRLKEQRGVRLADLQKDFVKRRTGNADRKSWWSLLNIHPREVGVNYRFQNFKFITFSRNLSSYLCLSPNRESKKKKCGY